jgi:CHAT domain-containing protein
LAEAFLDAGCAAVVQTYWDIDDQQAAAFMRDFIDAWAGQGLSPLRAINEVRRAWVEAGADPSIWAGYSIVLNRF